MKVEERARELASCAHHTSFNATHGKIRLETWSMKLLTTVSTVGSCKAMHGSTHPDTTSTKVGAAAVNVVGEVGEGAREGAQAILLVPLFCTFRIGDLRCSYMSTATLRC